MFISVDFPAPEGPMIETNSPLEIVFLFVGVEVFSCETVPLTTISCPSERPLVTSISFSVEIPVVT